MFEPLHGLPGACSVALATCALIALASCSANSPAPAASPNSERVRIGDISWYRDLDEARQVAAARDKPIWFHFGEHPG